MRAAGGRGEVKEGEGQVNRRTRKKTCGNTEEHPDIAVRPHSDCQQL